MQREDFAVLTNGFSRSSLEYTLQCIREAEIRKLCLWGGVTHCFAGYGNGEQLKEAKKRVKALGLSVLSCYPEFGPRGDKEAPFTDRLQRPGCGAGRRASAGRGGR